MKVAQVINGSHDNLVGIETLSGSDDNKTPQHAVLLGMSGAGKSVTVCDLLTQTEGYFGYTVIIEKGLSCGIYTATVEEGARPIIIHPDGDLTINYLDTKGLPLTPDHLSAATALVARMIGTNAQEDKQLLRQAQIAKYLNLLYEDAFQDWQKKRHDQLLGIARHALALQKFRGERMPPGATSLETFADFRDWKSAHPSEAEEYQRHFDEAEVLKFLKEPKTSKEARNLAFAYFTPDEFPTHRMLRELMLLDPMVDLPERYRSRVCQHPEPSHLDAQRSVLSAHGLARGRLGCWSWTLPSSRSSCRREWAQDSGAPCGAKRVSWSEDIATACGKFREYAIIEVLLNRERLIFGTV